MNSPLDAAVVNNATWCDAVCQALGRATVTQHGLWLNLDASPPFYPNAITLDRDFARQMEQLRALSSAGLPAGWAVKDSYAALDLLPLGFDVLFEASWTALPADHKTVDDHLDLQLQAVTLPSSLAAWEAAWRRAPENLLTDPKDLPVFGARLLADPDIKFLWAPLLDDGRALVIANRSNAGSRPVVGMSNLVLPADGYAQYLGSAVAAVRAAFPGLPLVSYDAGPSLEAMIGLGFEPLGPLRIWTKVGPSR